MIHKKREKSQNSKPIFFCPYHKLNNVYYPFDPDNIFPCDIKGCFCKNINGWVSNCDQCGEVIHNCIHGCYKGIKIPNLFKKQRSTTLKKNFLLDHYKQEHLGSPVLLYTDLDAKHFQNSLQFG